MEANIAIHYPIGLSEVNDVTLQLNRFTDTYRDSYHEDHAMCEARCIREQIPVYFKKWEPGDWFVGRVFFNAIGFSPQVYTKRSGFGYFVEEERIRKMQEDPEILTENSMLLNRLKDFWLDRDSVNLTRSQYPEWIKKILSSDNWIGESGIAFPLYRMGGTQLDYNKLVKKGMDGIRKEINSFRRNKTQKKQIDLYRGMDFALDTFTLLCDSYIADLKKVQNNPDDFFKRERIIQSLENIRTGKPKNLHEAIQLFFLYNALSGSQNFGRMDDFLGEFLVADLENGTIGQEEALDYLKSLFSIMEARGTEYDGRAVIGGKGRSNESAADQFALLAMHAIKESKTVLPQLTLRFYSGQNPVLYQTALDVLGSGCVYPMLYNDEVNIPSVASAFDISESVAEQYLPFGCGEYTLNHKSVDTPSGIINLAKALEVILHEGTDPVSGKEMGISINLEECNNFDDLLKLYKAQVEMHVEALAWQQRFEYEVASSLSPFLYFSVLYDSCVSRGKGIFGGGAEYLGGTLETYGNTVASDSLYAIKKLVFEDKKLSLQELGNILSADFKGFEKYRWMLKELPKYGNDHTGADSLYCELHDHVCEYTKSMAEKYDLHHYLVVIINNDANTDLGFLTGASADGRRAGKSLNNGNAPLPGNDKTGLTAFLNSISKPRTDIHAGAVQNIKFSKEIFIQNRKQVEAALSAYFKNGGAQAMITVVGKEDLEKAMENPEDYQNLMVRVGGFSARFVELRKEVQLEILERTLY